VRTVLAVQGPDGPAEDDIAAEVLHGDLVGVDARVVGQRLHDFGLEIHGPDHAAERSEASCRTPIATRRDPALASDVVTVCSVSIDHET
jgi:hypothetical protein